MVHRQSYRTLLLLVQIVQTLAVIVARTEAALVVPTSTGRFRVHAGRSGVDKVTNAFSNESDAMCRHGRLCDTDSIGAFFARTREESSEVGTDTTEAEKRLLLLRQQQQEEEQEGGHSEGRMRLVPGRMRRFATSLKKSLALQSQPLLATAAEATPVPQAIAEVLRDAAVGTAELAMMEKGAILDAAVAAAAADADAAATATAEKIGSSEKHGTDWEQQQQQQQKQQQQQQQPRARIHRIHAFPDPLKPTSATITTTPNTTPTPTRRIVTDTSRVEQSAAMEGEVAEAIDAIALAKTTAHDAFAAADDAILEAEKALQGARAALAEAKTEAAEAIAAAEEAAAVASSCAKKATELATRAATTSLSSLSEAAEVEVDSPDTKVTGVGAIPVKEGEEKIGTMTTTTKSSVMDVSMLTYDDVEYHLSEMAPPFIDEDQCLIPGEAVVRVEKAPDNSRRIFAGIDIVASVDDVWKVLTDYENLQKVVPNLVVNQVLELYESDADAPSNVYDPTKPDEQQCEEISKHMKGAKLRQVGGAKVVGINFAARTTLEVREWPEGMPDFAHYADEIYEGKSRIRRAKEGKGLPLVRYRFPRPFALSKLPTKDISMQSVVDDEGEFRLYQGVWRMQPLPGCSPCGNNAMRLTYAVEISPRPYLPVALVEGRIAQDLCTNLLAIRDHVTRM